MVRYNKWNYISQSFILSKSINYSIQNIPLIKSIKLTAGHYQFSGLFAEHGLIFNDILSQIPLIAMHSHGKKRRLTITLESQTHLNKCWSILDKLVNVTFPAIEDFNSFKIIKTSKMLTTYVFHLRKYFDYQDSNNFISERLLSKKDIFFPMTFKLSLSGGKSYSVSESYFRMLRLPFVFKR